MDENNLDKDLEEAKNPPAVDDDDWCIHRKGGSKELSEGCKNVCIYPASYGSAADRSGTAHAEYGL